MDDLLYYSELTEVPARGRCYTAQSTNITDRIKPGPLRLPMMKVFDLSSENSRQFLEQKTLGGFTAAYVLTGYFILNSVTQNEKQQARLVVPVLHG
ncbi:hypothetical protein NQZ68_027371 [Dissostichus eleginoides]|nr:hypothetical protein NQZ68_027371 [Dissostichus eleginoides]